ncbi:MAG: hypothetical protein RL065_932, partial [Bacteroidota bacterium]
MIKKTFTYLFLLTLLISKVNAQDSKPSNWCGTTLSKAQMDWLDEYQRNDASPHYRSKASKTVYVPIKAHIIGKNDGSGYYAVQNLLDDICDLNMRYDRDSIGIHFFLYEDIQYINNTAFYNDGSQSNPMAYATMNNPKYHRPGALNMFFVQNSPGLCGYFSPGLDVVVITGSCGGKNQTTVTHEVGHYFSLPHTFNGWEGVWSAGCDTLVKTGMSKPSNPEKVDGSNCHIAGDKFCDTRADYLPDRWNCPYVCSLRKDPNGMVIHPDSSLYMSYANDYCTTRFSHEQRGAMQANYNTVRSGYLLNLQQNANAVTGVTTIIEPQSAADHPADYVPLQWNKVAGAEKYLVAIYNKTNPTNQVWSRITTDTFASVLASDSLKPNLLYNVKIMAFNPGHPCNSWSAARQFSTSDATGINAAASVSAFKIYPNPASNYFLVNYVSENVKGFTLTVIDLSGRIVLTKSI